MDTIIILFVEKETEAQKCAPGTGRISITQDLIRNVDSQTPPQMTESKSAFK